MNEVMNIGGRATAGEDGHTAAVESIHDRRALVILGMHRSGTSACARAVSFCGYSLPVDLMAPRPDNPKGFWESAAVMRFNDTILKDIGASWDRPGPFLCQGKTLAESEQIVTRYISGRYREQARAMIGKSFGPAPRIVLKDPRLCLLLPLWTEALAGLGYASRLVFAYRNPAEVAASLHKRNQIPIRRGLQLWLYYNLRGLRDAERLGGIVHMASFHSLLEQPGSVAFEMVGEVQSSRPDIRDQIRAFVSASDNHHRVVSNVVDAPHIAGAIKDMWHLLQTWRDIEPEHRASRLKKLGEDFDEATLLAGHIVRPHISIPADDSAKAPLSARRAHNSAEDSALRRRKQAMRIVHYHLFKNAGTSVDEMLKRNFGEHWSEQEFPAPARRSNVDQVAEFLRARPELLALSSHTALLPVPQLDGEEIIPVIFLRHPIIRISSAYAFEKQQNAQTYSAQLAKQTDFAGYVRAHLDHPQHRGLKNFQTFRLALNEPDSGDSELVRAERAIATLPFIGLVEAYEQSVNRLEELVRPHFPNFTAVIVRKNVTRKEPATIDEELEKIRKAAGDALYAELFDKNSDDLILFEELSRRYGYAPAGDGRQSSVKQNEEPCEDSSRC